MASSSHNLACIAIVFFFLIHSKYCLIIVVVEEKRLIKLEYLSILELNGKGSFELLQGQITSDMEKVSERNWCIGRNLRCKRQDDRFICNCDKC